MIKVNLHLNLILKSPVIIYGSIKYSWKDMESRSRDQQVEEMYVKKKKELKPPVQRYINLVLTKKRKMPAWPCGIAHAS